MKRSEEAQQVMRLDWGELSVKRRRLARRPAGQCEKDTAEQSQPSPLRDCTGTEVALGPQEEECTGLRLHHVSASLRTEAQGTRKSSEVAHGVFSRIRVFFFSSSSFWKFCTFKLKCKVHLRQRTDVRTCVHTHMSVACAQPSRS